VDALLKKLNWKPPATVTVLGAPPEVVPLVDAWSKDAAVKRRLGRAEEFVVAFVASRADIAARAAKVAGAVRGDGVLWMAYPKKSSKRYRSDVDRDDGWQPLGDLGFEPVRQVAIDEDWSALRFRRAENIATMTRDPRGALSAAGRRRTRDPRPVRELLADLPDDRRPAMERLHHLIRDAAPDLEPAVWSNMLGYGRYPYRSASGREGEWYVVGLASQKRYLSLYLCAVDEDGQYLAEANADRLGKVSCGRSCVRFTKLDSVDLDVVAELVRRAADLGGVGDPVGSWGEGGRAVGFRRRS
jgi:hypothetical protein